MKTILLILVIFFYHLTIQSQSINLKITGNTTNETRIIDSIDYKKIHPNTNLTIEELNRIQKTLLNIGYINNQIIFQEKKKDSVFITNLKLGEKIKFIHIYIGIKNKKHVDFLKQNKNDTIKLPYSQIEAFLKHITQDLENNGYSFTKVKLTDITYKKNKLHANLFILTGEKRTINTIEINYENTIAKKTFPSGAKTQIEKKYKNKIFTRNTLDELKKDFDKFSFVNQVKYPEILFTDDTTKIFVYLQKRKANRFDGFLGINSNENKSTELNGYLNFTLVNALKKGEEFNLYWKNDGNNQKTLDAKIEIPYLFKSSIAAKGNLNIYKQDSTFQNTKTALGIGYNLNYNKKIFIGLETTESSNILKIKNDDLSDYSNFYYTISADMKKINKNTDLIPLKSAFEIQFGTGTRTINSGLSTKQNYVNINIMNNFYFNTKNIAYIRIQNNYIKSTNYLKNELYRFGGINSIRGFAENSLQSNFMIGIMTEYRYLLSKKIYLNSITDYCYYENPFGINNEKVNEQILGLGIGLAIETTNGFAKISITNGKPKNDEIKFYNTNITISYNVKF